MHDLIPLGPALPGALTTAEIDATMAYAEAEKALATREAYASDWRDFAAWCASRGATALPAHVGIVAAPYNRRGQAGQGPGHGGPDRPDDRALPGQHDRQPGPGAFLEVLRKWDTRPHLSARSDGAGHHTLAE